MKIGGGGRSANLEDRRGESPRGFGGGGMGGRGMGLGAILFAAFMAIVFRADFFSMRGLGQDAFPVFRPDGLEVRLRHVTQDGLFSRGQIDQGDDDEAGEILSSHGAGDGDGRLVQRD